MDGLTLYAASSDGTIAAFQFDSNELEGIATQEDHESYIAKFNFVPPPLPEGYSHFSNDDTKDGVPTAQQANGFDRRADSHAPEKVNILVVKKKRANLTSASNVASARIPSTKGPASSLSPSANGTGAKRVQLSQLNDNKPKSLPIPPSSFSGSFPAPSEQPFGDPSDSWSRRSDMIQPMDLDVKIDTFESASQRGKRKASFSDDGGPRTKARTLGGDRPVEIHVAKEISNWSSVVPLSRLGANSSFETLLSPLPLLTYLSVNVDRSNAVFEAKNAEEDGTTEIAFVNGKQTEWLDYLPSPAIALKATGTFCAVAMQDGSVNVYSSAGRRLVLHLSAMFFSIVNTFRRLMPTICLGSPCSIMEVAKNALLVVTIHGQLHSWYAGFFILCTVI